MRDKEPTQAAFLKLRPSQYCVGRVVGYSDASKYGRCFEIRDGLVNGKGMKRPESFDSMMIGENSSLKRFHLDEEIGNVVSIGCGKPLKTPDGEMRTYKVAILDSAEDVIKLCGPDADEETVKGLIDSVTGTVTGSGPDASNLEGDDDGLPF